jgi:hypothetical protein
MQGELGGKAGLAVRGRPDVTRARRGRPIGVGHRFVADSAWFVARRLSAGGTLRRIRCSNLNEPEICLNPFPRMAASNHRTPTQEAAMNRYQSNTPRPLLGIAAMALAVATLSVAVVVPSSSQAAAARALTSVHVTEIVRIEPARIEVIGTRETVMADERAAERPAS